MKNQIIFATLFLASFQSMAAHKCVIDLKKPHSNFLKDLKSVEIDSQGTTMTITDVKGASETYPVKRTMLAGGSTYEYKDDKQVLTFNAPEALPPSVKTYSATFSFTVGDYPETEENEGTAMSASFKCRK